MKEGLIKKYLGNSCSDEEFDEFVRWVNEEALDDKGRELACMLWEGFEPEPDNTDDVKYNALFEKIQKKIQQNQNQNMRRGKVIDLNTANKWLSRVAVILFLPLLGAVLYLLSTGNFQGKQYGNLNVDSLEIVSPIGSRTIVDLSDGTVVNLNYGSSLKYPAVFSGKKREVKLSGEGYFKVAHNPNSPFVVQTGKLNIIALGTEFNVCAYKGGGLISTTLINGKVELEKISQGNEIKKLGIMVPGQHVEYYTESEKIISSIGKVDKFVAWKEGKIVFDNDPILEVTEVLRRIFNVDFELTDEVKYLSYTVTFHDDPLYLILELMTETTPIAYNIEPRKRLPDGSFSKQKIKIYKIKNKGTN